MLSSRRNETSLVGHVVNDEDDSCKDVDRAERSSAVDKV